MLCVRLKQESIRQLFFEKSEVYLQLSSNLVENKTLSRAPVAQCVSCRYAVNPGYAANGSPPNRDIRRANRKPTGVWLQ